jgi:hypothetical protein
MPSKLWDFIKDKDGRIRTIHMNIGVHFNIYNNTTIASTSELSVSKQLRQAIQMYNFFIVKIKGQQNAAHVINEAYARISRVVELQVIHWGYDKQTEAYENRLSPLSAKEKWELQCRRNQPLLDFQNWILNEFDNYGLDLNELQEVNVICAESHKTEFEDDAEECDGGGKNATSRVVRRWTATKRLSSEKSNAAVADPDPTFHTQDFVELPKYNTVSMAASYKKQRQPAAGSVKDPKSKDQKPKDPPKPKEPKPKEPNDPKPKEPKDPEPNDPTHIISNKKRKNRRKNNSKYDKSAQLPAQSAPVPPSKELHALTL